MDLRRLRPGAGRAHAIGTKAGVDAGLATKTTGKPGGGLRRVHHVQVGELDAVNDPGEDPEHGFDAFFRAEFPKMVALASVLTGVGEVGRDVAQESMVKAFRDWSTVGQLDRPGAWVRRVTINAAMSWHRSRSRERAARSRLRADAVQPLAPPEDTFWDAVRSLPPRQRSAVVLHHLEDLPVAEVADVLGVAVGTVKASLAKGRAKLEPQLRHLWAVEGEA